MEIIGFWNGFSFLVVLSCFVEHGVTSVYFYFYFLK